MNPLPFRHGAALGPVLGFFAAQERVREKMFSSEEPPPVH